MGLFRKSRIRRTRDGRYELALPEIEREVLDDLAGQLSELLAATTDDPAVRRLFPTAYHDDVERDREYQQLVRDDLLERRLANLATVQETAPAATELDEEQVTAWMQAINDLRLVLGTRLDVSEEPVEVDLDDPAAPLLGVYDYLGYLMSEIVDALEAGLPPPTDTDPLS
ncbi:MAG: DUF2017 domain-containing protein [Actinomycetota bacterium]|nr:DUF2017 domain-containing protein [Actinomycetota bacterium]